MAVARTELEIKLLTVLRRISKYDKPGRLRKSDDWGLSFEEAIEMAYENIQAEAKNAIRGVLITNGLQGWRGRTVALEGDGAYG